jgi:uncharacterized protein (DUF302 family)
LNRIEKLGRVELGLTIPCRSMIMDRKGFEVKFEYDDYELGLTIPCRANTLATHLINHTMQYYRMPFLHCPLLIPFRNQSNINKV